ncbi:glycosyltransferase family 2 protein [Chryseobacterium sp.]|uniref:glycosyltransferase family 2 protein n=1 Tax=Chryseobacterium sp. TaxID=1871047 RepID=UPI00388EED42
MKISVALCTYNGEKYLKDQLDSILQQTCDVDEIVVCDDGSSDKTIAILQGYFNNYPLIFKIHKNEINLRSVKNFEKAITLCTGDIIFLSDQDDVWEQNKVETMVDYFNTHSDIQALFTNGFIINENNKAIETYTVWDAPKFMEEKGNRVDHYKILTHLGNYATGASMAFKKQLKKQILPFPIIENFHHDVWIAIVAAKNKALGYIPTPLFSYRCHQNQQVGGIFYAKNESGKTAILRKYDTERVLATFKDFKTQYRSYRDKENKFSNYLQNHTQPILSEILESLKISKKTLEKKTKEKNLLFYLFFKYLY